MNYFTYLVDGTVTGFVEKGMGEEITGTYNYPEDVPWDLKPEFYTAPSGILTAMTVAEKEAYVLRSEKDLAYQTQAAGIEIRKQTENEKPFPYNGQTYKSDASAKNDVEGVLGQCALYAGTAPIPTFPITASLSGKWITEENVAVPYTCDEFKVFATAYFNRFSWNFDNRVMHQLMLKATYDNSASTAQDILDYDFSEGWQ